MANYNSDVRRYVQEHMALYIFVAVIFVMGVIFGALMVNALSLQQKQEISGYLSGFFYMIDQQTDFDGKQSVLDTFGMHIKWLVLIWILGLSVIGFPLILILDFLKGVLIGFTVGYMVGQLSWKGMLFALVSVVPQNMIIIPVILICSVTAITFSLYLIKNRFLQRKDTVSRRLLSYTAVTVSMAVVLLGVSLFESFVSPVLMKWVTPMLVAL